VTDIEGCVRTLEREIRDHASVSAIGADGAVCVCAVALRLSFSAACTHRAWHTRRGQVNVTYTRKKKRMDTELEAAVELMSAKKVRGGRGAVGLMMTGGGGAAHTNGCVCTAGGAPNA
jgi:hypothetical protein